MAARAAYSPLKANRAKSNVLEMLLENVATEKNPKTAENIVDDPKTFENILMVRKLSKTFWWSENDTQIIQELLWLR